MNWTLARARPVVALGLLATVALLVFSGHLAPVSDALAYLGPAGLLFLVLWCGRYPGEKAIHTLAARVRPRAALVIASRRWRSLARLPSGGELLAAGLAGRGPPQAACPC